MMWGEASNRAALTGDLGAGPESMSTSEGRLFYVSAGKSAFNILGLFQQYRSKADITRRFAYVSFTPEGGHCSAPSAEATSRLARVTTGRSLEALARSV